jgi:dihydroorotase
MSRPLLIKNGRLIDPNRGIDEVGNMVIINGQIAHAEKEIVEAAYVLDASGMVVCPGFIDLHCHLRQPGFEDKETIASGSLAAARGGFTTICCMPNTYPPLDSRASVDYVKQVASGEAAVRVIPIGCISKGRQGEELAEMAELADAGVAAFSDDGSPVSSSALMLNAMQYSLAFGLPVIDHCEDIELSKGGQMNEGAIATRLGLQGIPAAAEEMVVARDIALAELCGARLHIAHVTTRGAVDFIRRAKERGVKVTAEVTPHHLTLTEEAVLDYDTSAKISPPLRTRADIEALIDGLKDDTIDIIATDHAPHTENEKCREFTLAPCGLSSLETALGTMMGLVHDGKLSLKLLIGKMTSEPARILDNRFGLVSTLVAGTTADIVIFNPDAKWTVDTSRFASKGRNTPLSGKELKGKVMATISRGKLVYKDDSITLKGQV